LAKIRVSQLAKELGVDSKAILSKLRDEGLGEVAKSHMSLLSLGLAESVRDWFRGGGTAVEIAPPVEAPQVKAKPRATRKKKADPATAETLAGEPGDASAEDSQEATTLQEVEQESVAPTGVGDVGAETKAPKRPSAPVPFKPAPAKVAGPAVVMEVKESSPPPAYGARLKPGTKPPQPPPAGTTLPAVAEAPKPAPSTAPKTETPAPPAGTSTTPPPATRPTVTMPDRAAPRPTVTLASKAAQAAPERKPVTPAPTMVTPAPATIQGPRLVRTEKPDVIETPRSRRPGGPPASAPPPSYSQPRAVGGRGVKAVEDEAEEARRAAKGGKSLSARRRGTDGRRGEANEKIREFTEADLLERRERLNAAGVNRANVDSHLRRTQGRGTRERATSVVQRGEPVTVESPVTVRNLAASLGIRANDLIGKLLRNGVSANINQSLDDDTAILIAREYGIELRISTRLTLEEELLKEIESRQVDPKDLVPRAPVVTILGHVDHGKTSLLDKIRSTDVAAGEAGGITQHTAAWKVTLGQGESAKTVTFIDTPGHQAFTSMRARGASVTDVVVLVVAAVEGVMPQTIESINHARAAGVPIVVALNKIDRPDANPDMVLGQLAKEGLNAVEYGGDTEVVRTSAVTGQGIKELLEILDYQAELLELKANPSAPARGTVIEAKVDPGMGSVATVLVQDGTLRAGDIVLAGPGYGRVRTLLDDNYRPISEAGPSTPVIVAGLNEVPGAGDKFYVLDDLDRARMIAQERASKARQQVLAASNRATANPLEQLAAQDIKTINLIIKADVQGSVETLVATVGAQNTEEVKVRVIHSGVGAISESDVELAMATKAKPFDNKVAIIGFHVVADDAARALAEQNRIDVKTYRVIYEIFDDLKKALSGMLAPEEREKLHGHAEVRQVFRFSKVGNIAGCFITDGHISRGSKIRVIRDGKLVAEGLSIETLRRVKDDVKEVKSGFECGIKLANFDDIKPGDRLEGYIREMFERTL
jgi:translation initiation factor IF-2